MGATTPCEQDARSGFRTGFRSCVATCEPLRSAQWTMGIRLVECEGVGMNQNVREYEIDSDDEWEEEEEGESVSSASEVRL